MGFAYMQNLFDFPKSERGQKIPEAQRNAGCKSRPHSVYASYFYKY